MNKYLSIYICVGLLCLRGLMNDYGLKRIDAVCSPHRYFAFLCSVPDDINEELERTVTGFTV